MSTLPTKKAQGADSGLTRRDLLIAASFCATAAAAGALALAEEQEGGATTLSLDPLVPDRVGGWTRSLAGGYSIPQGEDAEDRSYDAVVTRHYTSAVDLPIMLLIAYGRAQTGSTQLHRPEVCYPAAGFKLQMWPHVQLRLQGGTVVSARTLTAQATGRTEQILYWSRVGNEFPLSSTDQRLAVLRQALRGASPDGALVRISTIAVDHRRAMETLGIFARALLTAGGPRSSALLTGRP